MDDNLNPRPTATPQPMPRRTMDDFSATPTPRPMSIPVSSPPEVSTPNLDSSSQPQTGEMSLSELNSKIADDIAKEPINVAVPTEPELHTPEISNVETQSSADAVEPVPVPIVADKEKPEDKSEIIPGLNTKPEEDAFKDTPVAITDTSEQKLPDIDLSQPADKSNVGVVTSAQYNKSNKKGKGLAIIVAVLLAIALIAGAGYAYMQNTNQAVPPAETNTTTVPEVKETTPTEDINSLNNEIDTSLKDIKDTTDYQESDLTDTTLGL